MVAAQPGKALRAALTARFTSSSLESGISAITSPLAGLVTSSLAPSAASSDSPSMKFCSLVFVMVAISGSSLPQAVTPSTSSTGVYSMPVPSATAAWVTLPPATFTPGASPGIASIAPSTPWSASAST